MSRDPPSPLMSALSQACAEHRDQIALKTISTRLTYREFEAEIEVTAIRLMKSLRTGSRVALRFDSEINHIVTFFAILKVGCIPFLFDPTTTDQNLFSIAANCGITDLIKGFEARSIPFCRPDKAVAYRIDESTVICRFTSGTTGVPKCLEFSAAAVLAAARAWSSATAIQASDTILCVTPFSNGLAFNTSLLSVFLKGAALLATPAGRLTSRGLARIIEEGHPTRLVGYPTFYRRMVMTSRRYPSSTLKMVVSAASAMDPALRSRVADSLGAPVYDYYGVAEVGPVTVGDGPARLGAMGSLLPGAEVRVSTGTGALSIRTKWMATRYLNAPGLFESRLEDGFFLTSDCGHMEGTQLVLSGRADRVVKIGGKSVDLTELENSLLGMSFITDVHASVTLKPDGEPALLLEVKTAVTDISVLRRLIKTSSLECIDPERIEIVEELQRNGVGKLVKNQERTNV